MKRKIDWETIKQEYVTSSCLMIDLQKKYNIHQKTMSRKSIKDNWKEQREEYRRKLEEKTIEKIVDIVSEEKSIKKVDFLRSILCTMEKADIALTQLNMDINAFGREYTTKTIIVKKLKDIMAIIEKAQKCYRLEMGLLSKFEEETLAIQRSKVGEVDTITENDGFVDALNDEATEVWKNEEDN